MHDPVSEKVTPEAYVMLLVSVIIGGLFGIIMAHSHRYSLGEAIMGALAYTGLVAIVLGLTNPHLCITGEKKGLTRFVVILIVIGAFTVFLSL